MKIQSILLRAGGSFVELDGVEYHFKPQEDGAHVAEIENEDHQDRLLGITEGFKLYRAKEVKAPKESDEDKEDRDAWVDLYVAKFGFKPHHKLSIKNIQAAIDEAKESDEDSDKESDAE